MRNPLDASSRYGVWLVVAVGVLVASMAPAHAEDLKNRWYFGGNISFLSTTDDIRSNAAIIIGSFGDDGIPFTGDPNEDQGCTDASIGGSGPYCDPRPDDLLGRETSIEETFKLEMTAGYGLTSWLSLQLDGSYFKGNVGPIDTFVRQPFFGNNDPTNLTPGFVGLEEKIIPVQAGELTEIPVSLSGIVRFRKDSPLNPYVMVGAGMIFAQLDVSGDVGALNQRISSDRIKGVFTETNANITPGQFAGLTNDGRIPNLWPVTVNVDNAFEWHLGAGAEYFFNDKLSFIFDARYMFADQAIQIGLSGQDQVNFLIYSENLFRPDGSLQYFANTGAAPNTNCWDTPLIAYPDGSGGTVLLPSGNKCVTIVEGQPPTPPALDQRVKCTAGEISNFDKDQSYPGSPDICYDNALFNNPNAAARRPEGQIVVQGGKIDLSGLSVAVGMRFHW